MLPLDEEIFIQKIQQPLLFINSELFHRWDVNMKKMKRLLETNEGKITRVLKGDQCTFRRHFIYLYIHILLICLFVCLFIYLFIYFALALTKQKKSQ